MFSFTVFILMWTPIIYQQRYKLFKFMRTP